ncbi:hypothetical protein [Chryseobacterium indoltheticum]|uniref:hypothetical protein n=1 Tax=Chryseobacterium indoltheticum TaxID=254 RepID=UPI001913E446|nr:hypothetical protein [Chryseobacterium indoltheticum]QQQ28930.1 hypothetical protein JJL46_02640 [Chryseobacterium indoltheticum]
MKYNCQILNETKAVVQIVPETDLEKSLLNQMDKDNPDHYMLDYHYGKALELKNRYAVLLAIDSFQLFQLKRSYLMM